MNLKDKVVIITGATKGLGRELVSLFVSEGSQVVGSARSEEELSELASAFKIFAVKADVSKENEVFDLAQKTIEKFGRIDIWINNAGIWMAHAPFEEMDVERLHEMFEVNVFGTMYGSKAAMLEMKKRRNGVIVNILSTSALEGRPMSAGYCATKYAADGFTKSIRKELESFNVQVLGIYPGGMKTGIFDEKRPSNYEEFMEPSEVAAKIVANLKQEQPEEEQVIKRPA